MGDDSFIRRMDFVKIVNKPVGDTIFTRGNVSKKYIDDKGNYLVDIDCWVESIRGYVPSFAKATVS